MAYRLTPRARSDLDEIWDYSRTQWGLEQAIRYFRDLQRAMETAGSRGRACDDIRPGYLKLTVNSHILFFRRAGIDIEIVRILHQRMDFNSHL